MCNRISRLKAFLGREAVVLLLGTLLLAVPGCRTSTPSTAGPALPATPQPGRPPASISGTGPSVPLSPAIPAFSLSGEVRAKEQIDVSAKLPGRIIELKAAVGDQVKKKDVLVVLEHDALDIQVKQAEASVEAAGAALKGAQAQLALLQAGATKEQIGAAEAVLRGAEANLALLLDGATKEQIAAAQAGVAGAQARLDLLLAGPRPEQVKIAEFQVEMAKQGVALANYRTSAPSAGLMEPFMQLRIEERELALMQVDLARYQLELLKAPPHSEELAQLKAAVDGANAQLEALKAAPRPQHVAQLQAGVDGARAQVEAVKAPPRPQQVVQLEAAIDGAKVQVALAQASLLLAKAQREEVFVYSPLDGAVTSRSLGVGSLVSPGTTIITVVSREVEVVISVDEVDLRQVSPGQAVSIIAPAYPDQVFAGRVRAIAPVGNLSTRTFEVYIAPQDLKGLLRPGMSTAVSLPTGR